MWLIGAGAAMIALGVLWRLQFPIVKNIGTSSYVLVCGGLSALLLGVFHQVIDAWKRRSWATIFIWIGASAITLYLINGIVGYNGHEEKETSHNAPSSLHARVRNRAVKHHDPFRASIGLM